MKGADMANYRREYNALMAETDLFFKELGLLTTTPMPVGPSTKSTWSSWGSRFQSCQDATNASLPFGGLYQRGRKPGRDVESIKIGVVGGGSITYPNVRFSFEMLKELGVV